VGSVQEAFQERLLLLEGTLLEPCPLPGGVAAQQLGQGLAPGNPGLPQGLRAPETHPEMVLLKVLGVSPRQQ